jgi:hypothetical protein
MEVHDEKIRVRKHHEVQGSTRRKGRPSRARRNSVLSPTVRYTISLKVLLALACHQDLEVEQMDVITAFLNADVESNVYMNQPEGQELFSANGGRLVCHLRKSNVLHPRGTKGVERCPH